MTEQEEITPIKLRKRYVTDILNDPPHWFVRVGGYLMLFLVGIIIGICMLIRYPDTIKGDTVYDADTGLFTVTVPYSTLTEAVASGAEARIESDNRPHQQYGYINATLIHKHYSSRTQVYTIVLKPAQKIPIYVRTDTKGTATITVRERSLLERMCVSLKF